MSLVIALNRFKTELDVVHGSWLGSRHVVNQLPLPRTHAPLTRTHWSVTTSAVGRCGCMQQYIRFMLDIVDNWRESKIVSRVGVCLVIVIFFTYAV